MMEGLISAVRTLPSQLKQAARGWSEDGAAQMGAALAFYSIISLAPLLLVVIAIGGLIFGEAAAQGQIVKQIDDLVGRDGAIAIEGMLERARQPTVGWLATSTGLLTMLLGASTVFYQLREALNRIWGGRQRESRMLTRLLAARAKAFALLLVVGFLLLVSLVLSAVLAGLAEYTNALLPAAETLIRLLNFVIGLGIATTLFALLFRVLPSADAAWPDIWVGALFTAILFSMGKFAIGLYLGQSSVDSVYGAAGSLVVLLVWIYYSAQILLFGAEFTKVYSHRHGDESIQRKPPTDSSDR